MSSAVPPSSLSSSESNSSSSLPYINQKTIPMERQHSKTSSEAITQGQKPAGSCSVFSGLLVVGVLLLGDVGKNGIKNVIRTVTNHGAAGEVVRVVGEVVRVVVVVVVVIGSSLLTLKSIVVSMRKSDPDMCLSAKNITNEATVPRSSRVFLDSSASFMVLLLEV